MAARPCRVAAPAAVAVPVRVARREITIPTRKITEATRNGHCGPNQNAARPIGATSAPATVPYTLARAPTWERPNPSGSSRGTAAERATPYARESASTPKAAGYSPKPWM
jgi:hypothetical protein